MKIVKMLSIVFIMLTALLIVACTDTVDNEEDVITNIQLAGLSGQGTLESPYVMSLEVGQNKMASIAVTPTSVTEYDFDFVLGSLSEGQFTPGGSVGIALASNNSKTTLSLDALEAGTFAVQVKLRNRDLVRYVLVTVEEEVVEEDILVATIMFPTIENGSGTAVDPYEVTIDYTQSANYSFAIQPNNATNKTINWSIVKLVGEEFLPLTGEDTAAIGITYTATRLTIEGLVAGEVAYVKGETTDASDVTVFIKITISDFTSVDALTIEHLLEGEDTNYYFKTAVGTTWDMSESELSRKLGLMEGTAGPGGGQAVDNLTYWPNLYKILVTVAPEDASNALYTMTYSVPDIFTLNLDGSYEALAPGETILTITSLSNPEVSISILIVVEDAIYPGILTSVFEDKETSELSEWNFDGNPDNLGSRPLLDEWENVFLQTNTRRGATGDDGNQKIFYLGNPERVYGIALESRVNNNRGDINLPTAMVWNKVFVSPEATTIDIVIGNNDKLHNQYRILFVDEDGVIYIVSDWTSLTTPNGSSRVNDLPVPEGVKGKTAALIIEQRLTQTEDNAELHIKGIWLNQYTPVTAINLPTLEGTYGQGATFNLGATLSPASATNKALSYQAPAGSNITISSEGLVTVGIDTELGEYILTVISLDDPMVFEEFILTVDNYVPVTSFGVAEFASGALFNATFDSNSGVNHTDTPIQLTFLFNEGASNRNWTKDVIGTSVEVSNEGRITFVGVGESSVTFTPDDNPSLAFTLNFTVNQYTSESKLANNVQINTTEARNSSTSFNKIWDTQNLVRTEWRAENINRDHGGSKVADLGDGDGRIVLEGHSTSANFAQPINIIWNKVMIGENDHSFRFLVRSHDDDRILESSNFRVKVITLGETILVDTLIEWTTVAGRWKQNPYWFEVLLDISAYQNQEVIILIEHTGALQNNGEWAKRSDSAAGSYLHIKGFELLETEAPEIETLYHMYGALNPFIQNTLSTDFTVINNPYQSGINVYDGDLVKPFEIDYSGELGGTLTLPTTTPFINNSSSQEAAFYLWGLYPALNNSHINNDVVYEILPDGILNLSDNVLTFNVAGTTDLLVKYLAFGSTDTYITLHITITVK